MSFIIVINFIAKVSTNKKSGIALNEAFANLTAFSPYLQLFK